MTSPACRFPIRPSLLVVLLAASCGDGYDGPLAVARAAGPPPAARPARPASASGLLLVEGVPFVKQRPDFCGEACVEMGLRRMGHHVTQDQVFDIAGINPELGRGALAKDLVRALRRLGFDPGAVWYPISADRQRAAPELEQQLSALRADLRAKIPSIVCTTFDDPPDPAQHFRLVVGFDARTDEVIYHDPALDKGGHRRMKRRQLLARWPLEYKPGQRILVRIPLRPGKVTIPPRSSARHTPASYAQHIIKLRETAARLDGRFTFAVSAPFVVAGDSRADVRAHAGGLIKWAVGELKEHYFGKDPERIITVWLFKDRRSYWVNSKRLTGEDPTTPFGYYSSRHRALIMDIHTGGGTLVHEIVHPFIEANFPASPPWFNEGMGSLYEGVGRRNHHIWGYLNWRLPGLQRAIRTGRLPRFHELMAQDENQFYLRDPGTNYAQSRYLLYYLQDKGLLERYYRDLVRNQRKDPSGHQTLQELLGPAGADMAAFQRRWERYVLEQKYVKPPVK